MKIITKKLTALLLALLMIFSIGAMTASAANVQDLWVYDIYKSSVDASSRTLYSLLVYFANQFSNYNSSIKLQLLDESGNVCAYGIPKTNNINSIDFYANPAGTYGVTLDTAHEYTFVIPEGAFYTGSGILGAEYTKIFTGTDLCGANSEFKINDLGISSYFATKFTEDIAYRGKITFSSDFVSTDADNCTITLAKKAVKDGKPVYTEGAKATVFYFDGDKHCAELSFGNEGVKIDKYESYTIIVRYASFYNEEYKIYCAESVYDLSGKKLLKIREDYPFFDFLVELLGKDHKIIDVILTIMKYASKIKLVDSAYYNDVKKYIAAK